MILPFEFFLILNQASQALNLDKIQTAPPQAIVVATAYSNTVRGRASWYGPGFHGRRTASGEVFNQNALTAAHRTLPFGTQVRVTNLSNNRQVVVRINDRGPFVEDRIIDLSQGAAEQLNMLETGVVNVRLEYNL